MCRPVPVEKTDEIENSEGAIFESSARPFLNYTLYIVSGLIFEFRII